MEIFKINENQAEQRIDRFLKKRFVKAPLSFIFKSIRTNKIKVNGKKPKPETILQKGDEVKLFFTLEQLDFTKKEIKKTPKIYGTKFYKENLKIAYEDADLLVLEKAAGIAVHPGTKNYSGQTLLDVAQTYVKHENNKQKGESVSLVHRLDKDTSGLVILTKNDYSLRRMNDQVREKKIEKRYLALIKGELKKKNGVIKIGLVRTEGKQRSTKIIASKSEHAKESVTHYNTVEKYGDFSLMEIKLETGRMHQIRVHFATLKHPLVGDKNYGDYKFNHAIKKRYGLKRHFLHAYYLEFKHPRTGKKFSLKAELPNDLRKFLEKI